MVFTTESVMTIDIRRRELKSNIEYSQIKDIVQIDSNKLKLVFRREINNVNNKNYTIILSYRSLIINYYLFII